MQEYKIRIHDLPKDERPRERLIKNGASTLSDSELLAIINIKDRISYIYKV